MLLNKTTRRQVEPVARELFSRWPTEHLMADAHARELEAVLRPLGLQRVRSRHLRLLSARWSACGEPPSRERLEEMPGVGPYAADCWEILCRGNTAVDPEDKALLAYVEMARAMAVDTA